MEADKIVAAYREQMIGKRFVYLGKYGGETFGIVQDINVITKLQADIQTNWDMQNGLAKRWTKVTTPTSERPIVKNNWKGWALDIKIISENGNSYSLIKDKIYIVID